MVKETNIPRVQGTIYRSAGCPLPFMTFRATYVRNKPATESKQKISKDFVHTLK